MRRLSLYRLDAPSLSLYRLDAPSLSAAWTRRLSRPARQELDHHAAGFYFHPATDDFYTIGQQPPYVSHRNHAETAQP